MATDIITQYLINIYERFTDLRNSGKTCETMNNHDLSKIFEYYTCIKLYQDYGRYFFEYNDIDPTFKEENKMSHNDTGIDCCDLQSMIVQCKLRTNNLNWRETATFFGSQVIFDDNLRCKIIRWNELIIARNSDCGISNNLLCKSDLFIDKPYDRQEFIKFCANITDCVYPKTTNTTFKLRPYQEECINKIKNSNNIIVSLPTGTGKNVIILYSMEPNCKYLILVPRIILMEQLQDEIIKYNPKLRSNIQLIGDNNKIFGENKSITICVFNSVKIIEGYCGGFTKIYIDEAHHIHTPNIYCYENDNIKEDVIEEINDDDDMDENSNEIDEDIIEDINDELINVKTYTKIIKSLAQYNNNVYLSATIDEAPEFEYFSRDIRDMINEKYLCDYTIRIPIFSEDPTNRNICEYLLQHYRCIIIYCNSQKEGKLINKLMNEIQYNSSEYIDCKTAKIKRNNIIKKYKEGNIPFLINVRILVEGFDGPITKGVCFLHLPQSSTVLIQIIGRALRLHPSKNIANIILPFSTKDDENNICNFLKIIAKNDTRIKKSYENKKLGGYISIDCINDSNDTTMDKIINFRYDMIFNSMCIIMKCEEIWLNNLKKTINFIDLYKRRPALYSNNGSWLKSQMRNYKNNTGMMKIDCIKLYWEEFLGNYKKYTLNNEDIWYLHFNNLVTYIIDNNRPSLKDKNPDVKHLAEWLGTQFANYKNRVGIITKNVLIRDKWIKFVTEYKQKLLTGDEKFIDKLNKLEAYIIQNEELPQNRDPNHGDLYKWFCNNQKYYKTKINCMNNPINYDLWTDFITKYKDSIKTKYNIWDENLIKLEGYFIEFGEKPNLNSENNDHKDLANWMYLQTCNYNKNKRSMLYGDRKERWEIFIKKYETIFKQKDS